MSRDKKIELPCKIGDTVYVFFYLTKSLNVK